MYLSLYLFWSSWSRTPQHATALGDRYVALPRKMWEPHCPTPTPPPHPSTPGHPFAPFPRGVCSFTLPHHPHPSLSRRAWIASKHFQLANAGASSSWGRVLGAARPCISGVSGVDVRLGASRRPARADSRRRTAAQAAAHAWRPARRPHSPVRGKRTHLPETGGEGKEL